jgi:hypothetical protein
MKKERKGQEMIERTWVNGLPEIVQGLMKLLEEQGKVMNGGEEAWARQVKCLETPDLHLMEEGDDDCVPYRLSVYANTTEEGLDMDEPLLKLEIRPGPVVDQ